MVRAIVYSYWQLRTARLRPEPPQYSKLRASLQSMSLKVFQAFWAATRSFFHSSTWAAVRVPSALSWPIVASAFFHTALSSASAFWKALVAQSYSPTSAEASQFLGRALSSEADGMFQSVA